VQELSVRDLTSIIDEDIQPVSPEIAYYPQSGDLSTDDIIDTLLMPLNSKPSRHMNLRAIDTPCFD
jgi:hypothetical protein